MIAGCLFKRVISMENWAIGIPCCEFLDILHDSHRALMSKFVMHSDPIGQGSLKCSDRGCWKLENTVD